MLSYLKGGKPGVESESGDSTDTKHTTQSTRMWYDGDWLPLIQEWSCRVPDLNVLRNDGNEEEQLPPLQEPDSGSHASVLTCVWSACLLRRLRTLKSASTAYMAFAASIRPALKQELESQGSAAGVKEVGRLAGQRWRALSPSQKQTFQQRAREQKSAFSTALGKLGVERGCFSRMKKREFVPPPSLATLVRSGGVVVDSAVSKLPRALMDRTMWMDGVQLDAVEQWRCVVADMTVFSRHPVDSKQLPPRDPQQWNRSIPACIWSEALVALLRSVDPPKSAYMHFAGSIRAQLRAELPAGSGVSQLAKATGVRWGELGEEARLPFKTRSAAEKRKYTDILSALGVSKPQYTDMRKRGWKIPEGVRVLLDRVNRSGKPEGKQGMASLSSLQERGTGALSMQDLHKGTQSMDTGGDVVEDEETARVRRYRDMRRRLPFLGRHPPPEQVTDLRLPLSKVKTLMCLPVAAGIKDTEGKQEKDDGDVQKSPVRGVTPSRQAVKTPKLRVSKEAAMLMAHATELFLQHTAHTVHSRHLAARKQTIQSRELAKHWENPKSRAGFLHACPWMRDVLESLKVNATKQTAVAPAPGSSDKQGQTRGGVLVSLFDKAQTAPSSGPGVEIEPYALRAARHAALHPPIQRAEMEEVSGSDVEMASNAARKRRPFGRQAIVMESSDDEEQAGNGGANGFDLSQFAFAADTKEQDDVTAVDQDAGGVLDPQSMEVDSSSKPASHTQTQDSAQGEAELQKRAQRMTDVAALMDQFKYDG